MKRVYHLEDLSPTDVYFMLTQSIIPRPIAWVVTVNEEGLGNLAPFSYFNAVSSKPPLLMISITWSERKGVKDTLRNIKSTGEFTVNIPSAEHFDAVVKTAGEYEFGINEAELFDVETVNSLKVRPKLVKSCKVNFECALEQIVGFGDNSEGSVQVVFGRVLVAHIDETCFVDHRIDPKKLDPLARLGSNRYALLGDVLTGDIPKV